MSRLSKLMGEPQEVEIGGEVFTIHPLTMKSLPLLMSMNSKDPDNQAIAFKKLITRTLKQSVPDATDEEIESIGIGYFKELSEAIMKVNGLNEQDIVKSKKVTEPES